MQASARVGETALLKIETPFDRAEGIVYLSSGRFSWTPFRLEAGSGNVPIPIEVRDEPGLVAHVIASGEPPLGRQKTHEGTAVLRVLPARGPLHIVVTRSGESILVLVTDRHGEKVTKADVTLRIIETEDAKVAISDPNEALYSVSDVRQPHVWSLRGRISPPGATVAKEVEAEWFRGVRPVGSRQVTVRCSHCPPVLNDASDWDSPKKKAGFRLPQTRTLRRSIAFVSGRTNRDGSLSTPIPSEARGTVVVEVVVVSLDGIFASTGVALPAP